MLFSPFPKNFASAVDKEIKDFSLSDCMIQRSCQILTIFFSKKISKIDQKILWKELTLTLDENYLMQGQKLILATFVESFVLEHWITVVMRLRQVGFKLSKRSSLCLILKTDQSHNDFSQRQVLFQDSMIDSDGYTLSLPLDYVSYHFPS